MDRGCIGSTLDRGSGKRGMRREVQPENDGITRIGDILRRYEQQYLGG
jgi:hypothetical protein